MLQKLSEQIRTCHERAAEARDKAETTADPALRAEFLDMESRWLFLARSYQFTEGLADFTAANRQRQSIFERKRHDASANPRHKEPTVDMYFSVKLKVRISAVDPEAPQKAIDESKTVLEREGYIVDIR